MFSDDHEAKTLAKTFIFRIRFFKFFIKFLFTFCDENIKNLFQFTPPDFVCAALISPSDRAEDCQPTETLKRASIIRQRGKRIRKNMFKLVFYETLR